MLSPRVRKQIEALADEMAGLFTPPELIAGCEVLAVDDKDQYASDNGWIEARVGQHNRQRCRWRGQFFNVEVGDFVDVLFFASYRLFVVFGQGGTGAAPGPLAHNLLSANHPDTLAASPPAAGDLITGNDTPQWARLARGSSGQYVTPNNTTGELEWRDIPTVGITEFLYDVASDIATYFQMAPDVPTGGDQTIVSAAVSADDTLIFNLATNANNPGVDFINDGVWHLHLHAQKSGPGTKDVQLKFRVYYRTDPGGVETQIGTGYSESTANLTTSEAEYDLHLALDELAIDVTDRIVLKIYADVSGAGADPTVTVTVEGDTDARLEIPALTAASGGGWPFAHVLTVSTTDPSADYTTVTAAIADASAGDGILLDMESSAEAITVNKAVYIIGWARGGTVFTSSITITAAARLYNIKVDHTAAAARGFICNQTGVVVLYNCEAVTSGSVTSRAIEQTNSGSTQVYGGYYESSGAGTSFEVFVSAGAVVFYNTPTLFTSAISGNAAGAFSNSAGGIVMTGGADLTFNSDSGYSSGVWLVDESLTLKIKQATLAAAITAAASGDSIKLDTDTYSVAASQNIGVSVTIEGDGPEATIYTTSVSNAPIFDITADSITVVFRNLTLRHTGGGVAATGIFSNNASVTVVLDNCVLEITSGAGTTSRGLWVESGTWILRNSSKISVTSGTSKYGIYNDVGAATITIGAGCEVGGDTQDIYGDQSGSALTVYGILTNRLADWAGTVDGSIDPRLVAFTADVYQAANIGLSDFVATINGAPAGASVVYNAPSSGNEATIVPSATTYLAKMVLHNTTRSNSALISNVNTGTNTITLTANAPANWVNGDTITIRSQTNTSTISAGVYFVDFEITSQMDSLAAALVYEMTFGDSGGAGQSLVLHPFKANNTPERRRITTQSTQNIAGNRPVQIISDKFCAAWTSSGATTVTVILFRAMEQRIYGL